MNKKVVQIIWKNWDNYILSNVLTNRPNCMLDTFPLKSFSKHLLYSFPVSFQTRWWNPEIEKVLKKQERFENISSFNWRILVDSTCRNMMGFVARSMTSLWMQLGIWCLVVILIISSHLSILKKFLAWLWKKKIYCWSSNLLWKTLRRRVGASNSNWST